MKVSALIPTYNRRSYVLRAIESVLAQTTVVDEIIVIDDGSTDGTAEAIESEFGAQIRLVRQVNTGVSGARLRAIEESRGEWVAFLDSDDVWPPDRNQRFLEVIRRLPLDVGWLFGDMTFVTDEGEEPSFFRKNGFEVIGESQVFSNSLAVVYPFLYSYLPASLIRRKILLDAACFRSELRTDEDWLAAVQIACRCAFAALPMVVARISRTSDLFASSLFHQRRRGLDRERLRARRLIFSLLAVSGPHGRWGEYYANETRELCKLDAREGKGFRLRALEQFRYSISPKSIAFLLAAMLGSPGLRGWEALRSRIVQRDE